MPTNYEKVEQLITAQQKGVLLESPVYTVGEQLKDMARGSATAAELLAGDLDKPGMSIADAERKLHNHADQLHAKGKGSSVCIPPNVADRILREFYGIPTDTPDGQNERKAPASDLIDLSTFF